MTELLDRIFAKYGQTVTLSNSGGTQETKAFLQPETNAGEQDPYAVLPLGSVDTRKWTMRTRTAVAPGDTVTWGKRTFTVVNATAYNLGDELSHWWSVLVPVGEAAE